jgi:hypothetical protein
MTDVAPDVAPDVEEEYDDDGSTLQERVGELVGDCLSVGYGIHISIYNYEAERIMTVKAGIETMNGQSGTGTTE